VTTAAVDGSTKTGPIAPQEPAAVPPGLDRHLPNTWIGYALAGAFLVVEVLEPPDLASVRTPLPQAIWYGAIAYWYFSIYRMHSVLARATVGRYPIGPVRAILFQLIPFFGFYWVFRWTNTLAAFVNSRASAPQMLRYWAGCLFILGLLVGQFLDGGVGIFLLYATVHYLVRELRRALTLSREEFRLLDQGRTERRERIHVAIDAGLGAGFAIVLYTAVEHFLTLAPMDQGKFLLVVLIVLLGILKFVDRLVERVRSLAGLARDEHHGRRQQLTLLAALAGPVLLLLVGLSHALLHHTVDQRLVEVLVILARALLLVGGITYVWLLGARHDWSKAAVQAGIAGLILGALEQLVAWRLGDGQVPSVGEGGSLVWMQVSVADLEWVMLSNARWWALLALAGGLVVGQKGLRRKTIWTGYAPLMAAIAANAIALATGHESIYRGVHLTGIAGWGAGLALSNCSEALLHPASTTTEPRAGDVSMPGTTDSHRATV
jgi:hypothetical protein